MSEVARLAACRRRSRYDTLMKVCAENALSPCAIYRCNMRCL